MEYYLTNINDKSLLMLDLKVYHYSPVNLYYNVARSKECLCWVLGVIHTHQSRNWCQIFLQLLKFEQVLVKGGIGRPRPALSAQTSVENIVSGLPPAGYIEEEDIGVECFNMTKW